MIVIVDDGEIVETISSDARQTESDWDDLDSGNGFGRLDVLDEGEQCSFWSVAQQALVGRQVCDESRQ